MITLASGVQAELLLDPPDHRPADNPDTEIIERVLAAGWLTAKPIAIVTNDDGGMQFS